MNSEKFNMYAAAIIGSTLAFLLLNFFSGLIYGERGHHGEEPLAFAVEVADQGGGASEETTVDWAGLIAAADPANGEKIFKKCAACHHVEDGNNGVGPYLWGVVGRKIASASGYDYSSALSGIEGNWDLEHLNHFLADPKGYAPGTKMTFAGLKKAEDRMDVIAYLNQADGSPVDLTTLAPATEVASASGGEASHGTATESATHGGTEVASAAPVDFSAGDAEAGAKVFRKCRACHHADSAENGVGPSLMGVIGREKGSVAGFDYSDAMKNAGGTWTPSDLYSYLEDPKAFIPGNKMSFGGLKKSEDRVNVITYLNEASGAPQPLQ